MLILPLKCTMVCLSYLNINSTQHNYIRSRRCVVQEVVEGGDYNYNQMGWRVLKLY